MKILHIKMFDKPNWLRPEINFLDYYLHLIILAVVVFWLLDIFKIGGGVSMLTVKNVLYSIPLLTAGDLCAHTILQID